MSNSLPEQIDPKASVAVDGSTGTLLKGLKPMDKSMPEHGQGEEFIAILNLIAWFKVIPVNVMCFLF